MDATALILCAIGALWVLGMIFVVALCRGAALADREISSPPLRIVANPASGYGADEHPRGRGPVAVDRA